jgi:hypothetical protein
MPHSTTEETPRGARPAHARRHAALHAELEGAVRVLLGVVRRADPAATSGEEAASLVALFSRAERAATSGVALFAPVVDETGAYAKGGHGSAPEWLAALSGSSAALAQGRLAAARRAAFDPALKEALQEAQLSAPQLSLLTKSEAGAPGSAAPLLELVEKGASHQELSATAARLAAAGRGQETERARRARVRANRHFRWRQDEGGGIRGEFSCDEVAWAKVMPLLEAEAKERWKKAGAAGADSLEAHRLDAFLELMAGAKVGLHPDPGRPGARPHCVVIVNAESLRRGTTKGDELCEIEGIGPVSVEAATELLGHGSVQFLIKDGVDIKTVTSTSRDLPQRLVSALMVRDRTCCATGCGRRHGLVVDHYGVDFAKGGASDLDNLARLCPPHHDLKTYGGWRLQGEPGNWEWTAPAHPKSAQYIARARRLAAAKASARAEAKRNHPRQS